VAQNTSSSRAQELVDRFLDDESIGLLPLHMMSLRDRDAIPRIIGGVVATIMANVGGVREQELAAAVAAKLLANDKFTLWEIVALAKDGNDKALDILAAAVPWEPYDRKARAELSRQARDVGWESARRAAIRTAIYEALQQIDVPQAYRYGQRWEKGADGKKVLSLPLDRHARLFAWWLRKQTRNAMEGALDPAPIPIPIPNGIDDELIEALDRDLAGEESKVLSGLPPGTCLEDAKLYVFVKGLEMTTAEASRRLGMKPGTGRVKMSGY
jgi:hypothetical protein